MSKLNVRQRAFADEYIITGNATQSAIKAGYSERTARSQGQRLLTNVDIKQYIKEKLRKVHLEQHLTMEEALALTASIAKGEPQQFISKEIDPVSGEVLIEERKEFSAGFRERVQALEHYYKINSAFVDKKQVEVSAAPTFIDDISGEDDG